LAEHGLEEGGGGTASCHSTETDINNNKEYAMKTLKMLLTRAALIAGGRAESRVLLALAISALLFVCFPINLHAGVIAGPVTNALNGHVYYLLTQNTWTASETEAVSLGGHLATIDDLNENYWVFSTFSTWGGIHRALWIGLTDREHGGVFAWVSGMPVAFVSWMPGQPDNSGNNEHFVHFWEPQVGADGLWNDSPDTTSVYTGTPLHSSTTIISGH
jgi:hypothetical protein